MADITREDNTYARISTATTTQVYTGQAILRAIIVNATAAGTIGIVDNTTGTSVNVGQLKASVVEGTYEYNTILKKGIRIVTGSTSDITVVYKPLT